MSGIAPQDPSTLIGFSEGVGERPESVAEGIWRVLHPTAYPPRPPAHPPTFSFSLWCGFLPLMRVGHLLFFHLFLSRCVVWSRCCCAKDALGEGGVHRRSLAAGRLRAGCAAPRTHRLPTAHPPTHRPPARLPLTSTPLLVTLTVCCAPPRVLFYYQAESCSDGERNHGERATDCGGPLCPPCPAAALAPPPSEGGGKGEGEGKGGEKGGGKGALTEEERERDAAEAKEKAEANAVREHKARDPGKRPLSSVI